MKHLTHIFQRCTARPRARVARGVFPALTRHRGAALSSRSAFSMLEVALALGLFAFAIISILGLLAVTMNLDQDSANDTTVTRMSEETGAWLRSQPFATSHTAAAYAPTDTTPDFYYDAAGRMALTSTGAPATTAPADAYFSCTVTRRATPSNAMDVLVMTYSWPLKAQEAHRKTRRMHISISSGY